MASKWSELERINALRQSGGLTEDEFNAHKAKLIQQRQPRQSRGSALTVSLLIAGVAVICLLIALLNHPAPMAVAAEPIPAPTPSPAEPASPPPSAPPNLTPDGVATAFAVIYGNDATEAVDGGSVAFTPRRLVVVKGTTAALLSEGVRDRGIDGGACHACAGSLRIDYLNWNGTDWSKPAVPVRFSQPGSGWGEPPKWRVSTKFGLPAVIVETNYFVEGCNSTQKSVLKLTLAGVVKVAERNSEDCSGATLPQGASNAVNRPSGVTFRVRARRHACTDAPPAPRRRVRRPEG